MFLSAFVYFWKVVGALFLGTLCLQLLELISNLFFED